MKYIIIDTETTGLNPHINELLQVSIIDDNGEVLFNEYIKPIKAKRWNEAQSIHHISPEMVEDCKNITEYIETIQSIIDKAEMIVGYNVFFDVGFLEESGVVFNDKEYFDVMTCFAEIYGEWNDYFEDYKWQKLTTCARYYKYVWVDEAHNALADCRATLFCYKEMTGNG